MSRIIDNVIAMRIIYLLVQPFESTDAFKNGLIDANGNKLKKATTREEKKSTSMLHRLVWNLKRIINLAPGGSTRIGSMVAAYMLVKEAYENRLPESDSIEFFNENFNRVWNLPFEEREIVEDAFSVLLEDTPANSTGDAVSTDTPTMKKARKFAEFQVDDEVFNKFKNGKAKFRKWSEYLNLEDESQKQIYDFARRQPKGIIVLKNSEGSLRGIRYSRKGSGNWSNIKRSPRQLAESLVYNIIEVEEI